jgi:hypothetical protein
MTRIELKSRVGPDGTVSVRLPPGTAEPNEDVLVTIEPVEPTEQVAMSVDEWRRRIAETAGSITDPTFRRHEQGDLREPDSLDPAE